MSHLLFSGGGGSKTTRTPDSIGSRDTVEILLGISEGPCAGLVNGAKTYYADNTVLVNNAGDPNFTNLTLENWPGAETGETITMNLGGFVSPISVGVNLVQSTSVTRSGLLPHIQAVDFRIAVQALGLANDKGTFTTPLSIKFEYRAIGSSTWLPAILYGTSNGYSVSPPPLSAFARVTQSFYNLLGAAVSSSAGGKYYSFAGDREIYTSGGTPPLSTPEDPKALGYDTTGNLLYHWTGSAWAGTGLTTATGYQTFVDTSFSSTVRRLYPTGTGVSPTDARTGDLWLQGPTALLIFNGVSWVFGGSSLGTPTPPPTLVNGVWSTNAKISSTTSQEFRCFVPDIAGTYEYRVTKMSSDNTTTITSICSWESVNEVQIAPMTFDGVMLTRVMAQASNQFSSLPQLSGDYLGRIVKVPSNYDPDARTYTGVWDGTYQIRWTNNPAFCLQDFIENTTYGLSSVYPHTPNKWKFYQFGQYCDQMVLRPDGVTLRPRWTYNDYVTQPRDAAEMAQYIAGSAGALYIDDGNGGVDLVIDEDGPSIALFTPQNISPDGFSYSYTDRLARPNQTIVEFTNPNLNWGPDKRIIDNFPDQATYGVISENFIAVGCTDIDEAMARGRRRQIGGLTEKELVTFTTNRKGKYLSEWDIILCADPDMGRGITARVQSIASSTSLVVRDMVTFEVGVAYQALFDMVNPAYTQGGTEPPFLTQVVNISNAPGTYSTITFATALPTLAPQAAFAIQSPGTDGYPKPYRILGIKDDSGNGEHIVVSALELNRSKWAYVDTGVSSGVISYTNYGGGVSAPLNLAVTPSVRQTGVVAQQVLTLTWDRSPSKWVSSYNISHTIDGVAQASFNGVLDYQQEFVGIATGNHTFAVVAVSVNGAQSAPAIFTFDVLGAQRSMYAPANLRLVGGTSTTVFDTPDVRFAWDPVAPHPTFAYYLLTIKTSAGVVLRTQNVGPALTWTYTYLDNLSDGAGTAHRSLKVFLTSVDQDSNSSAPIELDVSNAVPPTPTVTVVVTTTGINVTLAPSTARDVVGAKLWVSTTTGFDPTIVAPVADTTGSSFFYPLTAANTYYVRAAFYDEFDQVGLATSAQQTVVVAAGLDATAATKLAGVATGATKNTTTYGATAPTGPTDGDIWVDTSVTPNIQRLRSGGAWVVAANLVTNTNQVTDGANLGSTAVWSSVTGTGKPANNADVTSANTAAAIAGQGALATQNNVDPSTASVLARGSIPPALPATTFSYTSTTSQIALSWSAFTLYRADGTTVAMASGSQTITGLSSGTTYKFYPYLVDTGGTTGAVVWVSGGTGVGSPTMAYTAAGDAVAASTTSQRGNVPLNGLQASTTSSGTGGGLGGGGGCMHPKTDVRTSLGWVKAEDLAIGDAVIGPDGLQTITHLKREICSEWYRVTSDHLAPSVVTVTGSHKFYRPNGDTVKAADLRLGDLIKTVADHALVTGLELIEEARELVGIQVPEPHLYYVGRYSLLCHNQIYNK